MVVHIGSLSLQRFDRFFGFASSALLLACSAGAGDPEFDAATPSIAQPSEGQAPGSGPTGSGSGGETAVGGELASGGSASGGVAGGGGTRGGVVDSPPGTAVVLSGFVVDTGGRGLENALVSRTQDAFRFSKTDQKGAYRLEAYEGDILTVAALGYQTRHDVFVTSSGQKIVLQPDPLLDSEEVHISFDHLRPGPGYSKEELKADLGTSSGAGFYDGTPGSDRAEVDPFESVDAGGRSLKVRFPAHQLKTGDSGVDTRIPLSGAFKDQSYTADELYLSYWMKLSDNFQLDKCGGKLPSLGGSLANTDDERWKGRIMWRRGGSIQFYPELPHDNDGFEDNSDRFWGDLTKDVEGGICEFEFTSYLTTGKWHRIELHYRLDQGGNGGLFEGWVDGNAGHATLSSDVFGYYRPPGAGYDTLTINQLLLSAFLGGSGPGYEATEDTFAWFDEFRVSTSRIP